MSVTGAQDPIQERRRTGLRVFALCFCVLTSGCGAQSSMDPVDWWHDLEGGEIAEARPPPPNVDAPYPNLASVPNRPSADPGTLRTQIATRLQANRANATYSAAQEPLTPLPAAAENRAPPAAGSGDQAPPMGAKLQAASAPPSPPPPVPAPAPAAVPAPTEAAGAAPMPPIPARPPPPPNLAGVPAATAAAPPRVAPPAPPPAAVPVSTAAVSVPFAGDSAALSPAAQAALRQLAQRRGTAAVAVTGYGEAASTGAPDQAAALPLAWSRAQAIARTLETAGVPAAMLRITAEAGGRGGVAALAD